MTIDELQRRAQAVVNGQRHYSEEVKTAIKDAEVPF